MRKRLLGLALVIIMILGCSMTTFAKTPEESGVKEVTTEVKEWGKAIDSIQDLFESLGDAVADGKAWYEGMKDGFQKTVAEAYIMNAGGLSVARDAIIVTDLEKNMIAQIWDYFSPIGYCMLLFYFLLTIVQDMQGKVRDFDIKYWITTIMKFVCVDALIYFGPTIVVLAMQLGNTFIDYFLNNPIALTKGEDGADYVNAVADYFANGQGKHFTKALSLYVYSLLLKGANTIPNIMILLHAASRKIELIIRGGILCIAIPDIVMSGPHSRGLSYVKKFFGICLYGFVMLLVVQIAGTLSASNMYASILDGGSKGLVDGAMTNLSGLLNVALYNFAAVGMLSASKSILNDFLS